MSEFLEGIMMVCFALSWPAAIYKSLKSRSTEGKSLLFLYFILIGDLAGVAAKTLANQWGLVFVYGMNTLLVATDTLIYYRNRYLASAASLPQKEW